MEPDANSVAIMRTIDRLTPDQRALVYEYGFVIVANFINAGVSIKTLQEDPRTLVRQTAPRAVACDYDQSQRLDRMFGSTATCTGRDRALENRINAQVALPAVAGSPRTRSRTASRRATA